MNASEAHEHDSALNDPLLPKSTVIYLTNLSGSTIDRMERAGSFPPRIRIGPRRVCWKSSHITAWLDGLANTGISTDISE